MTTANPRKRSSQDGDDFGQDHVAKRQCIEPMLSVSACTDGDTLHRSSLSNDDPRTLLWRSMAATLEHVGFSGASTLAMEAFASAVDAYMTELLESIQTSMLCARRRTPIAPDFELALAKFSIPRASILPHLHPPIAPKPLHLELADVSEQPVASTLTSRLLGSGLDGNAEKYARPYIPANFPDFPSRHTYQWTEKPSNRETDMRKVREQAAIVARQGEDALRRIMKVGKTVEEKNYTKLANKSSRAKKRHDLWERALLDMQKDLPPGRELREDDRCTIVNSERQYWRKSPSSKKNDPVKVGSG